MYNINRLDDHTFLYGALAHDLLKCFYLCNGKSFFFMIKDNKIHLF
jgi:hypothetical protein